MCCLSVVTTLVPVYDMHVGDKLNLPAKYLLNSKGYQLTDFAIKTFPSGVIACFFVLHGQVGDLLFIDDMPRGKDHLTTFTYVPMSG